MSRKMFANWKVVKGETYCREQYVQSDDYPTLEIRVAQEGRDCEWTISIDTGGDSAWVLYHGKSPIGDNLGQAISHAKVTAVATYFMHSIDITRLLAQPMRRE